MIVIDIPGKFMAYLDGTAMMQSPDTLLDRRCRDQLLRGDTQRRGKGYRLRVWFDDPEVAGVLADYADACIVANLGGEVDHAEVRAAKTVFTRLAVQGVRPI